MYQITFKKKAGKELKKLPYVVLPKVAACISDLSENPRPDGSKKLKASDENMWRIRIGNYRVLYVIDDTIKIINIRKIGPRQDVYKK